MFRLGHILTAAALLGLVMPRGWCCWAPEWLASQGKGQVHSCCSKAPVSPNPADNDAPERPTCPHDCCVSEAVATPSLQPLDLADEPILAAVVLPAPTVAPFSHSFLAGEPKPPGVRLHVLLCMVVLRCVAAPTAPNGPPRRSRIRTS